MSQEDIASIFKIHPRTVLRAMRSREITSIKVGMAVRTTPEDVCFSEFVKPNPDFIEARLELCASVYSAHLKANPERKENYEKEVKPYLPEIWAYYKENFRK